MKNVTCKILLAAFAAALTVSAASADPGTMAIWGDFTIIDPIIPVNAWIFDSANTNPTGFPAPVSIGVSGTYPAPMTGSLTVKELRDYYTSQGCPNNTMDFELTIAGGGTNFTLLKIQINGVDAKTSAGQMLIMPGTFGILTGLDLTVLNDGDTIRVMYTAPMGSSNIQELRFACVPEPVSMMFLGTGFLGLIASRLRKRRR